MGKRMNQALINELRARERDVAAEIFKLRELYKDEGDLPAHRSLELSNLLQAQASLLNGIAILVAANKR